MKQVERLNWIERVILDFYAEKPVASRLVEVILYSIQAGGKRLRPLLFLELLDGFGLSLTEAHVQVAAALEMIHTGSLIHDDLPAMDNDDYRRGRLTSHRKFGEDMAILAGDSLFLDSYALVARAELPSQIRVELIRELSKAAGTIGMVGGQVLDMEAEKCSLNLSELQTIHAHKTGKLLAYPFVAAGVMVEAETNIKDLLKETGEWLGLAFQVRDDILDVTASFEELGKTPNKDLVADKSTYPALLGLEGAKAYLEMSLDKVTAGLLALEEQSAFRADRIRKIVESLRLHG
ncbi:MULTISPECIES: polyprenyl synthetase family protein [unclassified Streptococcus]|uniref:polyprenyl synthetase family protein n=1 Tax=unclassified Streptococcus TaxID=2608887 RepID=UPI0010725163|nr:MULTISPECIES: farnesyl diphosphate synthase [unclassified Streptococcus]MBF0786815.1 polyprenyl synthetase family protein [Streptococcus sp. 19428wC2_LYSM12]MCQ9211055.1 polyprenyl synthetase family protein [Streptococcus sp. B01]MCQ9214330.1 polyprenyl synthetase family protein [Streptococcus sp. O1]TFV06357.1 polyprenyl synthetase family protein [Streptococcus sp. LYSM12]